MASNEIPVNLDKLISLATEAANGAAKMAGKVPLEQNTEAKIRKDLTAVIGLPNEKPPVPGARSRYDQAKTAKVDATSARRAEAVKGCAFVAKAVGLFKNHLGTHWNSAWQAVGFSAGSLSVPADPLPLLNGISAYLSAHSEYENEKLKVTLAEVTLVIEAITAARAASNQSVQDLGDTKAELDKAKRGLFERMSGLRAELDQLLSADDPTWYAFGFDRPADGWQPAAVEHLVLTPGAPGSVFADWDDARRAERYRVTVQTGEAPPHVYHPGVIDSECTITGLTSGSTVTVTVTALNGAGEGAAAASAEMIVG